MAVLNQQEQDKIGRLEELKRRRAAGDRFISDSMLADAERLADLARMNAETREQAQQQRQADAAAAQAAQQARMDQAATAAQEDYLRRRRFEFRGTETQWEQMKPRILEEYLLGGGDDTERRRHTHVVEF